MVGVDYIMLDVIIEELRASNDLVTRGYFNAVEKLRLKRSLYGIDCRVVPDNQLLCIEMDNELFELMFTKQIEDSTVRAIFQHMGVA